MEVIKLCSLSGEPVRVVDGRCDCAQVEICMAAMFILFDPEEESTSPAKAAPKKSETPPQVIRHNTKPSTKGFAGNRGRARY